MPATGSMLETEQSESDGSSKILQPGQRIKPNVSVQTAERWILQEFGLKASRMKELNSYDDINYLVEAADPKDQSTGKYIFKILNSMDSKKPGHIEAENAVTLYLSSEGFHCPVPQKNLAGNLYSIVTVPGSGIADNENNVPVENVHIVRLLSFVEGDILANIPLTKQLLFDAGVYLAQLDSMLMKFKSPVLVGLESHGSIWQLRHTPDLRQFVFIVEQDKHRYQMVQSILGAFDERVIPQYPKLEKGVIHGDFNEQNILVRPRDNDKSNYYVHGVIDFGDMHNSYYVFELAILLCYVMLECLKIDLDPFVGSGYTLAGYVTKRPIPKLEMELLRTCICARLCQSLVMGAYTHSLDEGNVYLLTTSDRGWKLMNRLWNETTDEQLQDIWTQVMTDAEVG